MSENNIDEKDAVLRNIGKRIQEYRQRAGLSQEQAAEMAGISQNHMSRPEQGRHDPHFYMIIQIAKALNVPLDAFAEDLAKDNINIFLQNIKDDIGTMSLRQLEMLKDAIDVIKKYDF